ncbi:MAG: VWA domain-containing protein, partial [Hyphomicrobium sp.]
NAFQANGATAGHLGIAWAWYLISPKWSAIWPSESQPEEHDPAKLIKGVVLMTDGMFNTEYEGNNGSSAQQALKLCANIKASGVEVFTVGFQAPANVLPLLKTCASKPEYAFDAKDGEALKSSFTQISSALKELRVTQ